VTRSRRRAAVIGTGFGGLAAAIRLQAMGFATTCFEAHDRAGGRAAAWHEDGFTFDAGPTVITAPDCLGELFALAGKSIHDAVKLLPVQPYYRLAWADGETLDYDDRLAETIERRWPADAAGYARLRARADEALALGWALVDQPFSRLRDMAAALPSLLRVRADRSVWDVVCRHVEAPHLREALSFHTLLVGGSPLETSSLYLLIHALERAGGVHFPGGGTGALVAALVRLFEDLGGELRLGCPVRRVRVTRGARPRHAIESRAGAGEPFDLVVSNADVHATYATLYRDEPAAAARVRRLERMAWSMSLVVVHVGTDRPLRAPAHHGVLFGGRYLEVLRDVFSGRSLPRDLALYVHAPGCTDRSLAPAGGDVAYVLCPVPHLGHAPLDWEALAEPFADRVLEAAEAIVPGLREAVVRRRIVTPRHFAESLAARHGAAFSLSPRLVQSAWLRPHNRDGRIPGLYLVGAGTHPGAGVPGVVQSAKATARAIAADFELTAPA
jgi:phytoene desaturase